MAYTHHNDAMNSAHNSFKFNLQLSIMGVASAGIATVVLTFYCACLYCKVNEGCACLYCTVDEDQQSTEQL